MDGDPDFGGQVLVERSGAYELVDSRLLTPDLVERSSPLMSTSSYSPREEDQLPTPHRSPSPIEQPSLPPRPTQLSSPPPTVPPPRPSSAAVNKRPGSAATRNARPGSAKSLNSSSSQPLLYKDHYRQFERTMPKRSRPMSARPGPKKKIQDIDREAVEKKEMAEAAYDHWIKNKDRETRKRRSNERKPPPEGENRDARSDDAFKGWLASKSRQKSKQRQTDQLRAKIITTELLSVDYSESEHAFERWLKEKNRKRLEEVRERQRRSRVDKEEMKVVLQNLKTRWTIDYKQSQYLHPNVIRKAWDSSPLYSTAVLPW